MQLVVVAGGFGTRMKNVLGETPKSLAPIGEKSFLEYQLLWLEQASSIHYCLGYKSKEIIHALNQLKPETLKLSFTEEDTPLDVIGSIHHAVEHLEDRFAVLLGDVIPRFPFQELIDLAKANNGGQLDSSNMFIAPAENLPGQKGNVELQNHIVGRYDKDPLYHGQFVDIGFWILQKKHILQYGKLAHEEAFFNALIQEQALRGVFVPKGSWEVGSEEGWNIMIEETLCKSSL